MSARHLLGMTRGEPGAADAFAAWVRSHPTVARLDPQLRDDVVQEVSLQFLRRGAEICERIEAVRRLASGDDAPEVVRAADAAVHHYVGRSLRNLATSMLRARRPERHDPLPLDLADAHWAAGDPADLVARAIALLGVGGPDVDDLVGLALGTVTMPELERREADGEVGEAARIRARNRLYTRHRRARQALADALEEGVRAGRIGMLDAEMVRTVLEVVLRRRPTGGA
ncbi:MAG: hypothetical protein R3F59_31235 [Myxococcota bacterium]